MGYDTVNFLNGLAGFIAALSLVDVLEWGGSLVGLLGAFLLATKSRLSRYGWVAFLVANIVMIVFAYAISRHGLLIQQLGFMGTSLYGMKGAGFFSLWTENANGISVLKNR